MTKKMTKTRRGIARKRGRGAREEGSILGQKLEKKELSQE